MVARTTVNNLAPRALIGMGMGGGGGGGGDVRGSLSGAECCGVEESSGTGAVADVSCN